MGIVTTSSETAFGHAPEKIYDFVTNPANWTKTYPGSAHIGELPDELPLRVGDTWTESGPDGDRIFRWHLAIAMRPTMWVFNSVGR
ncbi:MAG TPA: SRPBCC family protein, partial [Mycobacterium sp.]|nr:SRPBCC family protein [Mycobacterium sp.]